MNLVKKVKTARVWPGWSFWNRFLWNNLIIGIKSRGANLNTFNRVGLESFYIAWNLKWLLLSSVKPSIMATFLFSSVILLLLSSDVWDTQLDGVFFGCIYWRERDKGQTMSQYISKYHISKLATAKLVKVSPIMIAIAILWAIFLYYSGTAISWLCKLLGNIISYLVGVLQPH